MVEGFDAAEGLNPPSNLPSKRIRSGVRRRILERLTEGRATVTVIAREVDLRLPHASAELKRLREESLVTSDEETGARGACLALTALGWAVLRADEISRLESFAPSAAPEGALGRLVSVVRDQILIAFVRRPPEGPIPLPGRPLVNEDASPSEEDWVWSEPRERRPRWVSAEDHRPVPAPPGDTDAGHLGTWGTEALVWGLQRFRLIEGSEPLRLASGGWFGQPADNLSPSLPKAVPQTGEWRLGALSMGGAEIRPQGPVIGIGLDRLSRETLLYAAAPGAVTIASATRAQVNPRPLPLELLDAWVERAHPRLRPAARTERLEILRDALAEPADARLRRRLDDASWRRFRQHWGETIWSADLLAPGDWIDVDALSPMAELTLVSWAIQTGSDVNLVLEVATESLSELPQRSASHRIRMILVDAWTDPPQAHRLEPHPVLASMWARIHLTEGLTVPVNLAPTVSTAALVEEVLWQPPTRAAGVEMAKAALGGPVEGSAIPDMPTSESPERLLRAAVLSHPRGDEDWANRMEAQHPLVAWIASAPEGRWTRWQRVGAGLGAGWIDLMQPHDVPVEALAIAAIRAPPGWRRRLMEGARQRIREESEIAHRLRQAGATASPAESSWIANVLFAEVAWLPPSLQSDLAIWGVDRLLNQPPARCAAAISGLDWLAEQHPEALLAEPNDWRPRARSIALAQPTDHDLHLWAKLGAWLEQDVRPSLSTMLLIVERLPEEWWAPVAETLLSVLSEDDAGLLFLVEMDIAWPALILRPLEESHHLPGGIISAHGGVRRTLLARLERLVDRTGWTEEEGEAPGARMIADLRDALRSGRDLSTPSRGRTHSRVGWLALPRHLWPPEAPENLAEGDARITARLTRQASGWHADLSRSPLDI